MCNMAIGLAQIYLFSDENIEQNIVQNIEQTNQTPPKDFKSLL